MRTAVKPTAPFGPPRSLDGGRQLSDDYAPVLYVTPTGRAFVAWQRSGGALMIASATGKPHRLAANARPAALAGDSKGNLVLVWARAGTDDDSALVSRLAPKGTAAGPARLISDQFDYSFPQGNDAYAALLESGRAVVVAASSVLEPSTGGEYVTDYFATSPDPRADLVTSTPDVSEPAIVATGDDQALLVWDDDGVKTSVFDGRTLQAPTTLTHTPGQGPLGTANVAGASGTALVAGARAGKLQIIDLPAGHPSVLPGTSTTGGRDYVHDAAPALAPHGKAAVIAFTVNIRYPEDPEPPPPDAVRVTFR